MLITALPVEIMFQIFSNVSDMKDVHECTQVCKLWRRDMIPIYYKDTLVGKNHEQFLQLVLTRLDESGMLLGDFVQTLTFGKEADMPVLQKDFEVIINSMPSLKVIQFHGSSITDETVHYLEHIDKIAANTQLQEVSIFGTLYSDDQFWYEDVCELYHSINAKLKHQITTLSIFETSIKFIFEGQEIFDYISGFTKLKHLKLHNTNAQHGTEAFKDVTAVLDACCDNLQTLILDIDSKDLPYAHGDHKYHPKLTSLNLSTPKFYECYITYLIKYLPNLKELDITTTDYFANLFSATYASLQPDISFKFNGYLKQLQNFRCRTLSRDIVNRRDTFWQTIREIYNNQAFCDLNICFYAEGSFINEAISFDKQSFNVTCYFEIERFDSMAHSFDFFSLNSIQVKYIKLQDFEQRNSENDRCMSDLLTFAATKQQAQVHLSMDEERLILSTKPVVCDSNFKFPQDLSCVQYAYLEKAQVDNILLNNISTLYPEVKNMQLVNCKIQAESAETNECLIDLQQFRNLQELTLEFGVIQKEYKNIVFNWSNGGQENYYIYMEHDSTIAIYSIWPTKDILKEAFVLKLKSYELQKLILQSNGKIIRTLINT